MALEREERRSRERERERERELERSRGQSYRQRENLRRFMSYSLLATHQRDDESARARGTRKLTRRRFQPPPSSLLPPRPRSPSPRAPICLPCSEPVFARRAQHRSWRNVPEVPPPATYARDDILMTGGRTRADVEPFGGVSARPTEAKHPFPRSIRDVDLTPKESRTSELGLVYPNRLVVVRENVHNREYLGVKLSVER